MPVSMSPGQIAFFSQSVSDALHLLRPTHDADTGSGEGLSSGIGQIDDGGLGGAVGGASVKSVK